MDISVIKEVVREKIDPIILLEYYGIDVLNKNHRYNKVRLPCPIHNGDSPVGFSFDLNSKMFTCYTRHCAEHPEDWFFVPKDGSIVPRDIFIFVKMMEERNAKEQGIKNYRCGFMEALRICANLAGVEIDDETTGYNKEMIDKLENQRWMRSMTKVQQDVELEEFSEDEIELFKAQLPLCDYVSTRGFDQDILDFFEIGFSPEGVDEPYKSRNSDFIGRLIFTIRDDKGRIVGWSGRLATDNKELQKKYNKYMHKLDFDKAFVLYNYHNAKDFIKHEKEIIIVEGPWDVMRLWSYGIFNVVAIQGSSLTPEQLSLAISNTIRVKVFLDSDGAGQSGAKRICDQLMPYVDVYLCHAPDGLDPDNCSFDQAWTAVTEAKRYVPDPIPIRPSRGRR